MSTTSVTTILDEKDNVLVRFYRHNDGYPTGHGQDLGDFLTKKTLVNGLGGENTFNGAGCMAAMIISHLKGNKSGDVYIVPMNEDWEEHYTYMVYLRDNKIMLHCSKRGKTLFDDVAENFDGLSVEKSEKSS